MYPTAAAALGLGLTPHHDLEEKSEAAATAGASVTSGGGGGGSSAASTASNNNNSNNLDGSGGLSRRRSGRFGTAARGSNSGAVGAEGGFFYVPATGGVAGAGGPAGAPGAPGMYLVAQPGWRLFCGAAWRLCAVVRV